MGLTVVSRSEDQDLNINNSAIAQAEHSGTLLGRVLNLLKKWKPVFSQIRTYEKAIHTLLGAMLSYEKATYTGSAVFRGACDRDLSKLTRVFSRSPWNLRDMARANIGEGAKEFHPEAPIDVALDETHFRKVGRKIYGAGYGYDPQLLKWLKQRFSWMLRAIHATFLIDHPRMNRCLAMPIWFEILLSKRKRAKNLTQAEHERLDALDAKEKVTAKGIELVHYIRKTLDASGHQSQVLRIFADGSFSNGNFIGGLPHNTVYVGRFRKNAGLRDNLEVKRGKSVYGAELPTPENILKNSRAGLVPDQRFEMKTGKFEYGGGMSTLSYVDVPNVYWKEGTRQRPIRILLLQPIPRGRSSQGKFMYSEPAYLITTDLTSPGKDLVQGYLNRWQIEVMHRELKEDVGLGEMQGTSKNGVLRFHGALALMYGLVSLAAHRMLTTSDPYLPPLPIWRKNSIPRRPSARILITMLREDVERFGIYNRSSARLKLRRRWKLPAQNSFVVA